MKKSNIANICLAIALVCLLVFLWSKDKGNITASSDEPDIRGSESINRDFGLRNSELNYEEELSNWDPDKIEYLDEIGMSIPYDEKVDSEEAIAFISALSPELAKKYAYSAISLFFKDDALILVREHYRNPPTYSRFDKFLKYLSEREIISSDFKPAYFLKKDDIEALTFFFSNFDFGNSYPESKPNREKFALITETRILSEGAEVLSKPGDTSLLDNAYPGILTVSGLNRCSPGDGSSPYYWPFEANRNRFYGLAAYRFDFTDEHKSLDYQAIIGESMSVVEPTLEAVKEHGILHPTYPEFTMNPPKRKRPKPSARREKSR